MKFNVVKFFIIFSSYYYNLNFNFRHLKLLYEPTYIDILFGCDYDSKDRSDEFLSNLIKIIQYNKKKQNIYKRLYNVYHEDMIKEVIKYI